MKRWLKISFWLCGLVFLGHEVAIISDGLVDDTTATASVGVIFGTKVNENGSLSDRLQARLDRGVQLFNDGAVNQLYVSGGLGKEGHYEGTVMAAYLISQGIPESAVRVDNEGVTTRATALNFARDYPGETSAVVVSQYFHVTRCKLAFRQVGVKNVTAVSPNHFEWRDPYAALREFAGFYKYLIAY